MRRIKCIIYITIFVLIILPLLSVDSYAASVYPTQNYYGEKTNHNKVMIQGKEAVALDDSLGYMHLNEILSLVGRNRNDVAAHEENTEIPSYTISMINNDGSIATIIPKGILECIKGQNINVVFDMGDYNWTINGKSVREIKDVNLEVILFGEVGLEKEIKNIADKNPYVQFSLPYEGDFGFDAFLDIDLGVEYTGKYANVYSLNPNEDAVFINSAVIDANGYAAVKLSKSSDYVAVIGKDMKKIGINDNRVLFIVITILFVVACIVICFFIYKKFDYYKYIIISLVLIIVAYISFILFQPLNILVLGIDKRDTISNESQEVGDNGQADFVAIVHIDLLDGELKVISIPRETMVYIVSEDTDETESIKDKDKQQICLQYAYGTSSKEGCELMQHCLEDNFGLHTDCYIACSMGGIPQIIDAVGGVDIVPSRDYSYGSESINDWAFLSSSEIVHLDGTSAYDFIHFRNIDEYYSNQDRLDRQRDFIKAFSDKITINNVLTINAISSLFELYNGYITTNMSSIDYIKLYLAYRIYGLDEISIVRVPGIETHTGMYDEYEITQEGLELLREM